MGYRRACSVLLLYQTWLLEIIAKIMGMAGLSGIFRATGGF